MSSPSRAQWRMRRALPALAIAASVLWANVAPGAAQDVRGSVRATANHIGLVPIRQDTVSRDAAVLDANGRLVFDGHPVTCILEDLCTYYRAGELVSGTALSQDVSVTAWGLGVTGLSATALARTRQDLGGAFMLPRADDGFDLLLGYAELARERYRVRLGRMRTTSGLGFSGYDGAEVRVRPLATVRATGYAGRSLAPGLEEDRDRALNPIEAFVPDQDSWLFGVALGWDPVRNTALEARYQRDLLSDRSVLLSERASLDARSGWLRPLTVELSADWDVALSRAGKARLSLIYPVNDVLTLQATGRRYLPYFELWTIWGYFSPVAYHEAELSAGLGLGRQLHVRGGVAYRAYEDAHAPIVFQPLEDDAVRAHVGAVMQRGALTASAAYRLERAVGAFFSGGDAEVRWRALDALELGAHVGLTQQIMEFRLGDERIYGAGGSVRWEATRRVILSTGAALYAHQVQGRPSSGDWDQTRAWAALEVGFGTEPRLLDDIVPAAPLPEDYWPRVEADDRGDS
ncbi:MAG TPA: hypothetical protein VMN78_01275 [Longimicrobiales bacterium]|nr:hypothetical protein [Longimicrobiales bacterium]